jgi:hypothetical protein
MANINGFDPAAYSIDGARHRGELLRVSQYASTSGAEGIVEAVDCKVTQLATPGAGVAIGAGAVLVRNRSGSVRNQTYAANGRVESRLDIAPTGASPRSDLIVVRIKDPQYSPWGGLSGADTQYVEPFVIQNVPNTTYLATQLNLGYSAVALARVDIPANTSVITTAMIKDVRSVAIPLRQRHVLVVYPGATTDSPGVAGALAQFTNLNNPIFCPPWATELKLIVTIAQAAYITGPFTGALRAEYGYTINSSTFLATEESGVDSVNTSGTAYPYRSTIVVAGELKIPANYRGLTHNIRLRYRAGAQVTGRLRSDSYTTIIVDHEFVATPD